MPWAVVWLVTCPAAEMAAQQDSGSPMQHMLEEIRRDARMTASYTGRSELQPEVVDAMARVRRELFVPEEARAEAYVNRPLAIGHGQTISQPFIVALMTDLLELRPEHRVLEIGTGSGYQAAVLAELVAEVYTVEIVEALAVTARARLAELGYDRVHVRTGDGWHGWPEHAPYDGVIVTAVSDTVPPALMEQLAPGGRMVIPIGSDWSEQNLVVLHKREDGTVDEQVVLPVRFVPFTRSDDR